MCLHKRIDWGTPHTRMPFQHPLTLFQGNVRVHSGETRSARWGEWRWDAQQ